jgi:hypothetical protein
VGQWMACCRGSVGKIVGHRMYGMYGLC